ncbi:MAG: 30S ribosomal protein S20 [Ilumatobacteraceae bacterium]
MTKARRRGCFMAEAIKSELKTRTKTALSAAGTDHADEAVRLAVKRRLDMAAAKGVIHRTRQPAARPA